MEYFENLAELEITCPHEDAFTPDGIQQYFRVIKNDPPTSDCFLPTKIRDKKSKPDDCICKAVSIFDNLEALKNGYFKIPAHKNKQVKIAVLTLTDKCGLVKQTFSISHHSWWRSRDFDPESVSILEAK